MLTNALIC